MRRRRAAHPVLGHLKSSLPMPDHPSIVLKGMTFEWDLEKGNLLCFGQRVAVFSLDPSLRNLLVPLMNELGPDLYRLLVAYESSRDALEDYQAFMKLSDGSPVEAFRLWGEAVSTGGWGQIRITEYDADAGRAVVRVDEPWELKMQEGRPPPGAVRSSRARSSGSSPRPWVRTAGRTRRTSTSPPGPPGWSSASTAPTGPSSRELERLRLLHREEDARRLQTEVEEEDPPPPPGRRAIPAAVRRFQRRHPHPRSRRPDPAGERAGGGNARGTRAEILRHRLKDFRTPDQLEVRLRARETILKEGSVRFEVQFRRLDGSAFPAEVSANLFTVAGEQLVQAIVRDVSERRRAEEERRQLEAQIQHAQKLESLGLMAGGVAHDFNNLLMAILGNAELALDGLPDEHRSRRHIEAGIQACPAGRRSSATRCSPIPGRHSPRPGSSISTPWSGR